jgi:hypothetical protein
VKCTPCRALFDDESQFDIDTDDSVYLCSCCGCQRDLRASDDIVQEEYIVIRHIDKPNTNNPPASSGYTNKILPIFKPVVQLYIRLFRR